jgi:HD superfamily phosphohydrolase
MRRHPFSAVNLISDPIHGYIELTKRLTAAEASAVGLPDEDVAEEDLLDTAWVQRLRRISQLQSARWVFPTAEHSRFTHGLGVMHEAGLWARSLYPSLRTTLLAVGTPPPSEGLVVETLRVAGLLHDVGHGPFAHFFDEQVLAAFPSPPDPRRLPGKRLTHEDLSQRIIEDELATLIRGLRRAPGAVAERDAFATGETVDPAWVSFLISKPAIADPAMPRWVRALQPLLSGVFTVDNLDYVSRCSSRPAATCTSRSTSTGRSGPSTLTSPRCSAPPSRRSSGLAHRPTAFRPTLTSMSTHSSTRQPAGRGENRCRGRHRRATAL